jgi:hypothetical protein
MTGFCSEAPRTMRNRVGAVCVAGMSIAIMAAFSGWRATLEPPVAANAMFLFCNPLTDSTGAQFLVQAQAYGVSTMKVYVDSRSTLGIPSVPISQVVGVTDEAKCQRASRAVDSVNIGAPNGDGLYLVAVGTHYLALPATTNRVIVHLDNLFTVKNLIGQQ